MDKQSGRSQTLSRPAPRLLRMLRKGVLWALFVLGAIETILGAPTVFKWLTAVGITQSHTLGIVLTALVVAGVGLAALGPDRLQRWRVLLGGEEPASSATTLGLRVLTAPKGLRIPLGPPPLPPMSEAEAGAVAWSQAQAAQRGRGLTLQQRDAESVNTMASKGAQQEAERAWPAPPADTPQIGHVPTSQYEPGRIGAAALNLSHHRQRLEDANKLLLLVQQVWDELEDIRYRLAKAKREQRGWGTQQLPTARFNDWTQCAVAAPHVEVRRALSGVNAWVNEWNREMWARAEWEQNPGSIMRGNTLELDSHDIAALDDGDGRVRNAQEHLERLRDALAETHTKRVGAAN